MPSPAALSSPTNNATFPITDPTRIIPVDANMDGTDDTFYAVVQWNQNGGWGSACPDNRYYEVYFREGSCSLSPGSAWTQLPPGNFQGGSTLSTEAYFQVQPNTTYCWVVNKRNNTLIRTSQFWLFTVTPGQTCGNGSIEGSEQCDNGAQNGVACDPAAGGGSCTYCSSACQDVTITAPRPSVTNTRVTNDTCGVGFSGRATSLNPNVTNPWSFEVVAQDSVNVQSVELYLVPRTNADGARNGVFEQNATPLRDTVISKVAQTDGVAISFNPVTGQVSTLNSSDNWVSGAAGSNLQTYRADVTATMSGSSQNPTVTFTVTFEDDFYNGTYSVYYTAINQFNASPENDAGSTANIRLSRFGNWDVDMTPPDVFLSSPNFILNNTYQVTRSASETGSSKQSGIKASGTRAYVYTDNGSASYQYKVNDPDPFQNLPMLFTDPSYPSTASNINTALNGTFTFLDLQNELEVPVTHALYVEDNACNVGFVERDISALALVPPWLMAVGGAVSAGSGIENIEIPDVQIILENIYEGLAVLSTETVITGSNTLPDTRISGRNNILRSYGDEAIDVPGSSNFDDWYSHVLDRVEKNLDTTLQNAGDVETRNGQSQTVNGDVFPVNTPVQTQCDPASNSSCVPLEEHEVKAIKVNNLTIRSGSVCNERAIIFVEGNLTIEPDLTTGTEQSGCIFVVNGDLIVTNGQQKTNEPIFGSGESDYDIIEGFFILNGAFITENDDGPGVFAKWDGLMVVGGVYAADIQLRRDLNGNGTGNLTRPAHLFVHDARYKRIYDNSLGRRTYSIREITR
jgi:hypothetical protein